MAWGTFFAALTLARRRSHSLKWSASCAGVIFAAWIVAVAFLRNLFSVEIDHYFHISYSIAVVIIATVLLGKAVRESSPARGAPSAQIG